ncbi:MAG: cupin domain-containing protein [Gemmatimonadales bacterium]
MHARMPSLVLAVAVGVAIASPASSQAPESMHAQAGAAVTWADLAVPGFAPGMKLSVLHGDPAGTGLYTLRLSFPAGYRFPPHFHPNAENLTVLSGSFELAMGDKADAAKLATYQPGDYLYLPGNQPHFGGAKVPTVVQLHGQGPFSITVVPGQEMK